jgi:ABC-2 type transport system permease protein
MMHQALEIQPRTRPNGARIVGAIAAKDLSQLIRNRTLLSVILTTLFLLVFYRFLPLLGNEAEPAVLIYDPAGESALTLAIDGSDELRAHVYDAPGTVTALLKHGDVPELGLVLPDDIQARLDRGGPLQLVGYVNYWVSDREAAELTGQVAAVLSAELNRPVSVSVADGRVYADADGSGLPFLMAISLVIAILMVGLGAVPLLMLEEKQTRTLDALLVSPATPTHVTLGKALAGLFLAGAAAAITLLIYRPVVVQWGLALAAAAGWALWAIALGLLAGSLTRTRQQHQIVMWVLFIPLIIPAFLMVMTDLLPVWLPPILRLLPSAASMDLLRMTGMATLPAAAIAWRLGIVYGTAVLLILAVAGVVRRQQA